MPFRKPCRYSPAFSKPLHAKSVTVRCTMREMLSLKGVKGLGERMGRSQQLLPQLITAQSAVVEGKAMASFFLDGSDSESMGVEEVQEAPDADAAVPCKGCVPEEQPEQCEVESLLPCKTPKKAVKSGHSAKCSPSTKKKVRGKDASVRQPRGTAQTFAGRRPPQSPELNRVFHAIRDGYAHFKSEVPKSTKSQEYVWHFMKRKLAEETKQVAGKKSGKQNRKPEDVISAAFTELVAQETAKPAL